MPTPSAVIAPCSPMAGGAPVAPADGAVRLRCSGGRLRCGFACRARGASSSGSGDTAEGSGGGGLLALAQLEAAQKAQQTLLHDVDGTVRQLQQRVQDLQNTVQTDSSTVCPAFSRSANTARSHSKGCRVGLRSLCVRPDPLSSPC